MQQESAQELVSDQCHLALLIAVRVILPAERSVSLRKGKQAVIGNRDAVRIASQIMQDMLWPTEWPLGIDHPVLSKQRSKKLLGQFWAG